MPRQRPQGITIAFLGTGEMEVNSATDYIEEYIEAHIQSDEDPVVFVFPITSDEWSETISDLVEMAQKSDITYEVITQTNDQGRQFAPIIEGAAKNYHVADVYTQLEQILTEAPRSVLEVLWDSKREKELGKLLSRYLDAGIEVLDLIEANIRMSEEDDQTAEPEETEEAAEDEPVEAEDGEIIYAKSELEKMSRDEVKKIAVKLNLPPRRSSAAMIEEILEAQGEPETEEAPGPIVVAEETEEPLEPEDAGYGSAKEFLEVLGTTLLDFRESFSADLEEFRVSFAQTLESVVFNTKPEEPMDVDEAPEPARPTRRLARNR